MEQILITVFTVVASVGSSAGFWTYMEKRGSKQSATTRLLRGLAHQKVIALGARYIERGWLTMDEYDDFVHYIYEPYSAVGGNGLAERVYNEVRSLPVRKKSPATSEIQAAPED